MRPLTGQMKVCEHELYKGVYCGLCHALRKRYGTAARFLLNYDLCFLALLYWTGGAKLTTKRCFAHPLRGRKVCRCPDVTDMPEALAIAADATVLVSIWKLEDNLRDEGVWKRLAAKAALMVFGRAGRKAEKALPETAKAAREAMERLWVLEEAESDSLDAAADCFAALLSSLALPLEDEKERRVAAGLLYQLGRWVYITDAAEDLTEDLAGGAYNPLKYRFGLDKGWTEEALVQVRATLSLSRKAMGDAAALWRGNACEAVWRNVLELGLEARENAIFTAVKAKIAMDNGQLESGGKLRRG